jgi:hypothetical protein
LIAGSDSLAIHRTLARAVEPPMFMGSAARRFGHRAERVDLGNAFSAFMSSAVLTPRIRT